MTINEEEIANLHKKIGLKVKKVRTEKKMTQLELSLEMGYKSVSLVSAAELNSDNKHFNIEHLYKISKILELDMEYFFKE